MSSDQPATASQPMNGDLFDSLAALGARIPLALILAVHWCLFWLTNGLDKFLNYEHVYGADFSALLENALLPSIGINSGGLANVMAYLVGLSELGIGVLFLVVSGLIVTGHRASHGMMNLCITLSITLFLTLSFGAIIFGARDAMLQHGVFIGVLLATWLVIHVMRQSSEESA